MNTPNFDIDLVRAFVAVADTRSFTQAAGHLHRTQSAVSLKIKKLEEQVGCRLFDRDTTAVKLTAVGERFLGIARRLIAVHEEAFAALNYASAAGKLTVATSETYAACLLPPVLARTRAAFPNVEIEIRCGHSWQLLDLLGSDNIDLVVATKSPKRVDGEPLARERLHWVAAADSRVEEETPLPLAMFPDGCLYRRKAIDALNEAGRHWRVAYSSLSHEGLMAAVSSGSAVTVMIESAVRDGLRVLGEAQGFANLMHVDIELYRRRSSLSPLAAHMADTIRRCFRQRCLRKQQDAGVEDTVALA